MSAPAGSRSRRVRLRIRWVPCGRLPCKKRTGLASYGGTHHDERVAHGLPIPAGSGSFRQLVARFGVHGAQMGEFAAGVADFSVDTGSIGSLPADVDALVFVPCVGEWRPNGAARPHQSWSMPSQTPTARRCYRLERHRPVNGLPMPSR